jgi:hypothetical protein
LASFAPVTIAITPIVRFAAVASIMTMRVACA